MFSWGFLKIHWYGFFIVLGLFSAFFVVSFLADKYKIKRDDIIDLFFYLFIFGVLGARIYDIFLEWEYYAQNLSDIFKIWQGGLAIHGAIFTGIICLYFFIKYKKIEALKSNSIFESFVILLAIISPGLALGQSIGRWGNYFNQELFGLPSNSFLSIFISPENRPFKYFQESHFYPTFLYESIGCFFIFLLLFFLNLYLIKSKKNTKDNLLLVALLYFILYSLLRFFLEFVRIDFSPQFLSLRWPQVISLLVLFISLPIVFKILYKKLK